MPAVIRKHPSEHLHRQAPDDLPTQQATIEWIIGAHYVATGNRALGVRHLLKAAEWLDRAGAPLQARELRDEIAWLSSTAAEDDKSFKLAPATT